MWYALNLAEGHPDKAARIRQLVDGKYPAGEASCMGDAVVQTGFKKIAYIPLISGENLMDVLSIADRASGPIG